MKILVAVDNRVTGEQIAALIRDSEPQSGAEVRVVTVIPTIMAYTSLAIIPALMQELRDQARHEALALVHNASRNLLKVLPEANLQTFVVEGTPAHEILSMAKDWEADSIYVGSHGRKGVSRLVLGSVSQEIVSKADCQVFVVKDSHAEKTNTATARAKTEVRQPINGGT